MTIPNNKQKWPKVVALYHKIMKRAPRGFAADLAREVGITPQELARLVSSNPEARRVPKYERGRFLESRIIEEAKRQEFDVKDYID